MARVVHNATEHCIPLVDLSDWLDSNGASGLHQNICIDTASALRETGCLLVRDPRVHGDDNDTMLDMMGQYFERSKIIWKTKGTVPEEMPHLHYQVGVTPEHVEVPKSCVCTDWHQMVEAQPQAHRATLPRGPDCKWRYMWRVGPRPDHTQFKELNSEPVIPHDFPKWQNVMDMWGSKILQTAMTVAEMAAVGFGMERHAFTSRLQNGPHVVAPTGTDLAEHGKLGNCFAGFHYDLNFLTLHGKSRFPGLHVWLRDGRRVPVRVPQGCILVQAGKQFEWLTGGHVAAGLHEVVCTDDTLAAMQRAQEASRSLWRVSSTVFVHVASDAVLQPLPPFAAADACSKYPAVPAGLQVQEELEAINLKKAPLCAAVCID